MSDESDRLVRAMEAICGAADLQTCQAVAREALAAYRAHQPAAAPTYADQTSESIARAQNAHDLAFQPTGGAAQDEDTQP